MTAKNKLIKNSLLRLNNYCELENYKGYSLYDSHNSYIPFKKFGIVPSFYVNQIVKRAPINLRFILGVEKSFNPKGMGLFLYSYLIQKSIGNPLKIKDLNQKILHFFNWLNNNFTQGHAGYCWGYNYPWPKKDGSLVEPYSPTSVVTGFNIRAIFEFFLNNKDNEESKRIIKSSAEFILNDIPYIENSRGICFSYTTAKKDITINANLLAGEILAYSDYVSNKDTNKEIINKILNFTSSYQNDDGSWYYSYDIKSNKPKIQIDFHQGYILESIYRICKYSDNKYEDFEKNIKSGLEFYRKKQFSNEGKCHWRIPTKWPIDIHNQSQGIITFSNFKNIKDEYLDFSKKIAIWTIENMQNKKGNFYYQSWPFITNKISYMRWNQAWMMVALSTLMKNDLNR